MKKLILTLLLIHLVGFATIKDWDYMPFISYDGQYPGEVINEGRNFDLLLNLWEKPKSMRFSASVLQTVLLVFP